MDRDLISILSSRRDDAESSDGVCNFILYFVMAEASDDSTLHRSTPNRIAYNLSMYIEDWSLKLK